MDSGTVTAPKRISGQTVVVASLLFVALGISALFWASSRAAKQQVPAIVVLPFGNDYFAGGFTIELIDSLTKVENLHIASWRSAVQFPGKATDLQALREQLQAGSVVDGSLIRKNDRVQVEARVVDTMNGQVLWSQTYDRPALEISSIQAEIAKAIVYTLKVQLRMDPQRILVPQRAQSIDAYDDYLHARYLKSRDELDQSSVYAERAIEKDPKYSPAYGLLALNRAEQSSFDEARRMAKAALAMDQTSGEAHAALAASETDPKAAEVEWQRAVQWTPGSAELHAAYAMMFLAKNGRWDEASYEARRAVGLDPLSKMAQDALAAATKH